MFANGLAFVIANIISFVINTLWSFSSKLEGERLLKFLVVTLISFSLTLFIAWGAGFLGLHYLTGVLLIICIVPMLTFLMHNYWTYK